MADASLRSSHPPAAGGLSRRQQTRVMLASTSGTVLEWYDFNLYGLASALIFGPQFFNSTSIGGVLASFATLAAGFVARPIGGILLGGIGDRVGRRTALLVTMIAMGVTSALIGLLPTYQMAGIAAPILLVVLRLLQGLAIGGEFGGATLLTIENAPPGRRGLWGAIPSMGTGAGFVLACVVLGVLSTTLSDRQFEAWGWRVAFLLSILLVLVGYLLRRGIDETASFKQVRATQVPERMPILTVLKRYPEVVVRAACLTASGAVFGYLVQNFLLSYGVTDLGVSRTTLLWVIGGAIVFEIGFMPFWGWVSDRIGRRRTVLLGMLCVSAFVYPFFALVETKNPVLMFIAVFLAMPVFKDMAFGPQAALIAEMFDTRVRYTGVSTGRELGSALFGGTAPFLGALFVFIGGGTWLLGIYVILSCVVTAVAILTMHETASGPLDAAEPRRPLHGQEPPA